MDWLVGFTIIGSLFGVAGVSRLFSPYRAAKRTLKKSESVSIADIRPPQLVKVVGLVEYVEEPMRAPFSSKPCAYHETFITQWQAEPGPWNALARDSEAQRFAVRDSTGRVIVDPAGARVRVVHDAHVGDGGIDIDADNQIERLMARHRKTSHGRGAKLYYRQGLIEAGQRVEVYGLAIPEPTPDGAGAFAGYRRSPLGIVLASSKWSRILVNVLSDDGAPGGGDDDAARERSDHRGGA